MIFLLARLGGSGLLGFLIGMFLGAAEAVAGAAGAVVAALAVAVAMAVDLAGLAGEAPAVVGLQAVGKRITKMLSKRRRTIE